MSQYLSHDWMIQVESQLVMNISGWEGGKLDPERDSGRHISQSLSHDWMIQVESQLVMNISGWEGGKLDPERDTANYTCRSSDNSIGPGVNSSTVFRFSLCKKIKFLSLIEPASRPLVKIF